MADHGARTVADTPALANPLTWFSSQGWSPFPFQREVWQRYRRGESGLIHSATGTGKTYAVWLAALEEWQHTDGASWQSSKAAPAPDLRVLWITPMRALAADTAEALRRPVEALGLPWTVETRTGDTSVATRQRQRRRLPTALITTPESLSLILTWPEAQDQLRGLRLIVVDEWHELLSSKRGTQTELALARLRRWRPEVRTWGLSATLGNLPVALRALLGQARFDTGEVPAGALVHGETDKAIVIDSILPARMERFPWAGHLALTLLPEVLEHIRAHRTSLVFCNTRHQVERWYRALLDADPDLAGQIAIHHGSVDADTRSWIEDALRRARLKCVVCTSSLDLGVDFPEVDTVLQIGSPKGVARLIQRAGRSGHAPGRVSRVICVPAHALELLEISAARQAMQLGHLEERPPVDNALDVLVQHLVTIGLGTGFTADDLYREVRTAYSYRHLSVDEWRWALAFVAKGGPALQAYPQYQRVREDEGMFRVSDRHIAQVHRLSIGTIVSDNPLTVRYVRGGVIGQVEESFASRLRPGDRFTLAGKTLRFVRLKDLTVWVRRSTGAKGLVPRWQGSRMPLSAALTASLRQRLTEARDGQLADAEMAALAPIFEAQRQLSRLPAEDELLIERLTTREGHHLYVYPFAGRLVHEGLAALTAYRLARVRPITFTLAANDYGFELLSAEAAPLEQALADGLFSRDHLADDIAHSLNASEMARRQFREIARVAGLVPPRYPGGQRSARQVQASSGLIFDVLSQYDGDNRLLAQARREVLVQQLEQARLTETLARINAGRVVIHDVPRPTPFAFPLMVDRMRQTVSSEDIDARIARMVADLERATTF